MSPILTQKTHTGKVWENKRFSLGRNFKANKQAIIESQENRAYENEVERGRQKYQPNLDKEATLGLSSATIPTKTPERRIRKGLKGISGLGKLSVTNAGYRLQQKYGKARLGFTTLTLPTLPTTLWVKLRASDWEQLEAAMRKMFLYYLSFHGIKDFVSVLEIQQKRYLKTGHPYPHWHCIHPSVKYAHIKKGSVANPWYIDANKLRKKWAKIVWNWIRAMSAQYNDNFGKHAMPTVKTFKASVDMQPIKKDASRYIAKYVSKGGIVLDVMVAKNHTDLIPYQWWYVSKDLKKEVKAKIIHLRTEVAKDLFQLAVKCNGEVVDLFVWYKVLEKIQHDGKTLVVAVFGQLTPKGVNYINSTSKSLSQLV